MANDASKTKPSTVTGGNPRITVAFPFSKIELREPTVAALPDLAALVQRLAEQLASIAHDVDQTQARSADALVEQATAVADRLS
jgi:hypothetical protein